MWFPFSIHDQSSIINTQGHISNNDLVNYWKHHQRELFKALICKQKFGDLLTKGILWL